MDRFVINGNKRLKGTIRVNGSKNASLPILAASLLTEGESTIKGVPDLSDTQHLCYLLERLGMQVTREEKGDIKLRVEDEMNCHAEYDLVRKMRASVCVMGPLLARRGRAQVSLPGGCNIGYRPIGLHLQGLEALGADVELIGGDIHLKAKKLRGAEVFLGGPFGSTVLGTANVLMAACLAEGTTVIECAACEPEVTDLADYLNKCGARITGQGTPRITIEGVTQLRGCEHEIVPDRIEAGTFIIASAITNGDVKIENCRLDHLLALVDRLRAIGVNVERTADGMVQVSSARRLEPVTITTQPYPGFPTDLQAQAMSLLCLADGNSVVTEKIFPDRFVHVAELNRMGARLRKEGPTVIVEGVKHLVGAPVMASDLRASAALVLAGLVAKGTTTVSRVYHIDRGYDRIEQRLNALGADIRRVPE
ncbi:MAG: UDP-N-acetylglucosamine 1-carboxyvinyltransferase [Phycisphaerales bacterium]|nr:UDP-N-acetylglucosamine 1-carboxyvinyltransferase [Phycisphaerales bacterium]MCB9862511.1 UDP-N-acetylglucosamine 1-carboxyvinyltransferase [Phycisphaerales bacterium]